MRISVRVKPNARQAKVEQSASGNYLVWVDAPAKEGRANQRLLEILSEHFAVAKSRITLLKGAKACNKILEI
jgi:uncharacterized protein YggU (UPF0235/DUF167 family)